MSIDVSKVTVRHIHLRECQGIRGKHDELAEIQAATGKTMRIVGTCLVAEIPLSDGIITVDVFSFVGKNDQGSRKRGRQITTGRLWKLIDVLEGSYMTVEAAEHFLTSPYDCFECVRLHAEGFDEIQRAPIAKLKRSVGVR